MFFRCVLLNILAISGAWAGTIASIDTIDVMNQVARGTVEGVGFTFTTTLQVARPHSGAGGINGGSAGATTTVIFDSPYFTPSIPAANSLGLGSTSSYSLVFDSVVRDVTVNLFQLEGNRLTFTSGGSAAGFSLLSSDGNFTVVSGNQIEGSPGAGSDASGSLFFAGEMTELAWSATSGSHTTGNTPDDGMGFIFSANAVQTVPEPASLVTGASGALVVAALVALRLRRRGRDNRAI